MTEIRIWLAGSPFNAFTSAASSKGLTSDASSRPAMMTMCSRALGRRNESQAADGGCARTSRTAWNGCALPHACVPKSARQVKVSVKLPAKFESASQYALNRNG